MKPPLCTPIHQGLSNGAKSMTKSIVVWYEGFQDGKQTKISR